MTRLNFSPFDDRGRFYHFDKVVVQWCGKNELNLDQRYDYYAYGIRTCFMHLPDGCLVRFTMMQLQSKHTRALHSTNSSVSKSKSSLHSTCVCVCACVCGGGFSRSSPFCIKK